MRDVFQSIYRFSSSMFLLGLQGFVNMFSLMNMFSLRNMNLASASTTEGRWFGDRMIHTLQDPVDAQTRVVDSDRAPTSGGHSSSSAAQKASQEPASDAGTGQAHTGWTPMLTTTPSVPDPPSSSPEPTTSSTQPPITSG